MNTHITIYTSTNCPFSKLLKDYLFDHDIPYEEKNVSTSGPLASELETISGDIKTPFVVVDGEEGKVMSLGWNDKTRKIVYSDE